MKRMTLIGAVALGVTLVWACSSAVEDLVRTPDASAWDSVSTSGERLQIRPIVYEGDDGSVIRMGEEIFDTELGVVCEPGLAADGVVRCLPKAPAASGSEYADPGCTQRVIKASTLCDSQYVRSLSHGKLGCSDESGPAYSMLVKAEGYSGPLYGMSLGECVMAVDFQEGYVKVDAVDPVEFAALSRGE